MELLRHTGILRFFIFLSLAIANSSIAKTYLQISPESSLNNHRIQSGNIKVLVSYEPLTVQQIAVPRDNNLQYSIFYNDIEKIKEKAFSHTNTNLYFQDLDNSNTAEIVVKTYSGGAHCCTNIHVYSWQEDQFRETSLENLDAGGGEFKDLNGDKNFQFLTVDQSFLYKFGSYIESFPPSAIFEIKQGEFKDVTRQYPQVLKSRSAEMRTAILVNKHNRRSVNSILASYVAQNILLDNYEQAWEFMLANYDPNSEWGLEIQSGDQVVGMYPDFPTALEAFLIEQGYLNQLMVNKRGKN